MIGALALVAIPAVAVAGGKSWNSPPIVASNCSGCHGVDGNAQLPYFPKLAGLDAKYAEKKLAAFKEPSSPPVDELFGWVRKVSGARKDTGNVTRDERISMEGMAHDAKPEVIREALVWYAKQIPAAGHAGDPALMAQGKELFTSGLPAQKILSCMTCHGEDAQGKGVAPRLAGQNADYLEGQLAKFRKGDRRHAPEMTMVTKDLDPEQARAAAVYLQSR